MKSKTTFALVSLVIGGFLVGAFGFQTPYADARRHDNQELERELEIYKSDKVDYQVIELNNGFQIMVTSKDEQIVKKLQEHAGKLENLINEAKQG